MSDKVKEEAATVTQQDEKGNEENNSNSTEGGWEDLYDESEEAIVKKLSKVSRVTW